jgi:hypothetical protein
MVKVQDISSQTAQFFSVLSCDQQLYRVDVQIAWEEPERFNIMYLRFGGMHALMSFVGATGSLLAEIGLFDILSQVFRGVTKMLSGKKSPKMSLPFKC